MMSDHATFVFSYFAELIFVLKLKIETKMRSEHEYLDNKLLYGRSFRVMIPMQTSESILQIDDLFDDCKNVRYCC